MRIRTLRTNLELRQGDVAERAGISIEMVSRLERGQCLPSVPTLISLARVLGTTPNDLLSIGPAPESPEIDSLTRVVQELPEHRIRDVQRIAETFARYGRDPKRD